ncbi:hypothetical protein ECZU18_41370 [Escherichia coli]|nr:hypothetical protein ECZU18_41370 [Escherichia coli]
MAMSEQPQPVAGAAASTTKARTSFGILGAISLSHLLNDMIQSLILAIYPLLQSEFSLTFMQIGMITLTFQLASSLLQPVVGYWTDKYPMPWSLPIGMCFTLSGLVLLALAGSFGAVLLAAALVGTGSSVFHPESSRVARMASGGRHGWRNLSFRSAATLAVPGTLAGGGDYRALWQRQRCLVCACGTAGDRGVGANQPLVLGTAPNE